MIELEQAGRRYTVGESVVTALDGVDLTVEPGALVVILGPSGCGKTTLLNLIGGLDRPSSGSVLVAGHDIGAMNRRARFRFRRESVSFIFQTFNLLPGLSALENVTFGADVAGRTDAHRRSLDALAQVGLAERTHHFPHQLSGGEQQRVAIARALATGNPVLLADEPTGELDFQTGIQILGLLQAQASAGCTVLVVTHNREIARAADRIVELSGGKVIGDGPPPGGRKPVSELHW